MSTLRAAILRRRRRRNALLSQGGGGPTVITTFTQSLGAELLTNPGNPFSFSGDDPVGWTIFGESGSDPAISEVGADGNPGTGAIHFLQSSGTMYAGQSVLSTGSYYEVDANLTVVTSGQPRVSDAAATIQPVAVIQQAHSNYLGRAGDPSFRITSRVVGTDYVITGTSCKLITLNAEHASVADGTFEFRFTLPGSPKALEAAQLWYRANGSDNFWRAQVRRNQTNTAWDFLIDSIVSGAATNRLTVTGVGTPNALRVIASGNDHTGYTSNDGGSNWTPRGTTVTNSTHATNTGVRAVYNSAVTPVKIVVP